MKLVFDPGALEDLRYWVQTDRKIALRILKLIDEITRDPFRGIGKPEPLKFGLAGCWSRRIDQIHRFTKSKAGRLLCCLVGITMGLEVLFQKLCGHFKERGRAVLRGVAKAVIGIDDFVKRDI